MKKQDLQKLIKEELKKALNESKLSQMWDSLGEEDKLDLLFTAVNDPQEAESYLERKYNELPPEVSSNLNWDRISNLLGSGM